MPITLTNLSLRDAVTAGAYHRFAACPKSVQASHKNRHTPAAVKKEVESAVEAQTALLERTGGVFDKHGAVTFPPGKESEGKAAFAEWMQQTVELPGEKCTMADLIGGALADGDYDLLKPFLDSEDDDGK